MNEHLSAAARSAQAHEALADRPELQMTGDERIGIILYPGFTALDMLQTVERADNVSIRTTRAPLRVDGVRPATSVAAPRIGQHTDAIRAEFGL